MDILNELILLIKKKSELKSISNEVVKDEVMKHLKNIDRNYLSTKEKRVIMKEVRSNLRRLTGRFKFKNKIKNLRYENLLEEHSSTKERLPFYLIIKDKINSLNVSSILDLGCGLNPIAIAEKKYRYYALDIMEDDLEIVNNFFKENKISGETISYDLRKINDNLPKADICLIMKVFDVLEKRGHKLAEKILTSVNSDYFLVSFSTKTLSGKPMNHPQRGWIERLFSRLGFAFESFAIPNEIFYLAKSRNKLNSSS